MREYAPALWDFAGFDGLALARALFGEEVSQLAAYQSLETEWNGAACSLLRLCENNFRVSSEGGSETLDKALHAAAFGRRVWVKPSPLASLLLEEEALGLLPPIVSVKLPHRLAGLPMNRAVPGRIAGCATLIWRHLIDGVPAVEIQTAPDDLGAVSATISV